MKAVLGPGHGGLTWGSPISASSVKVQSKGGEPFRQGPWTRSSTPKGSKDRAVSREGGLGWCPNLHGHSLPVHNTATRSHCLQSRPRRLPAGSEAPLLSVTWGPGFFSFPCSSTHQTKTPLSSRH